MTIRAFRWGGGMDEPGLVFYDEWDPYADLVAEIPDEMWERRARAQRDLANAEQDLVHYFEAHGARPAPRHDFPMERTQWALYQMHQRLVSQYGGPWGSVFAAVVARTEKFSWLQDPQTAQ